MIVTGRSPEKGPLVYVGPASGRPQRGSKLSIDSAMTFVLI
jgi:hypothetical protein